MPRITVPTNRYNASFGDADNITAAISAVETGVEALITIVDTSIYWTAPDTSVYSWTAVIV